MPFFHAASLEASLLRLLKASYVKASFFEASIFKLSLFEASFVEASSFEAPPRLPPSRLPSSIRFFQFFVGPACSHVPHGMPLSAMAAHCGRWARRTHKGRAIPSLGEGTPTQQMRTTRPKNPDRAREGD